MLVPRPVQAPAKPSTPSSRQSAVFSLGLGHHLRLSRRLGGYFLSCSRQSGEGATAGAGLTKVCPTTLRQGECTPSPDGLPSVVGLPPGQRGRLCTARLSGAGTQGPVRPEPTSQRRPPAPASHRSLPPYKVLPLVGRLMVRETLSR